MGWYLFMICQRLLQHNLSYAHYCSSCFTILYRSKEPFPPLFLFKNLDCCPTCHQPLQETLTARSFETLKVKDGIPHLKMTSERAKASHPLFFQSASSLLGLTFGVLRIDGMLGGIRERTHLLLLGSFSNSLAERLCLRAILSRDKGGLSTRPIFIDAGNSSDLYLFSIYAREHAIEPCKALEQVLTARCFTVHQLADLVAKKLPHVIRELDSKLIIIAGLLSLFEDPQVEEREAERIVSEIGMSVKALKEEMGLAILSTIPRKSPLVNLLMKRADIVLEVEEEEKGKSKNGKRIRLSLIKHPTKGPSSTSMSWPEFSKKSPLHYRGEAKEEVVAYG